MGFFASRWIEKHGAETEKAAISTVTPLPVQAKTKWYSRKKEPESLQSGPTANKKPNPSIITSGRQGTSSESNDAKPPNSYGTWSASSPSPAMEGENINNEGYGTMRKIVNHTQSTPTTSARPATDTVTVTLAQRLDELATANADGLLSDDEYRILRQNLFERFGSVAAQIPAEQSPISLPSPLGRKASSSNVGDRTITMPQRDSNFNVSRSKSTRSVRSNTSQASSVHTAITSLIRKATGRNSTSRTSIGGSGYDAESTYSKGSRTSSLFPRGLPRTLVHKASAGSMQTSPSIAGGVSTTGKSYDVRSIASRRTNKSGMDNATILSRTTTRSRPPSSYHRRHAPSDAGGSDEIGTDWTAAELRAEILSLEEENKKLMDMFNGLEMTVMMKYRPALAGRLASDGTNSPRGLPPEWMPSDGRKSGTQDKQSSRLSISSNSMRSFAGLQRKGSLSFLKRSQNLPPLPPLPTAATTSSFASKSAYNSPTLPASASSSSSLHPIVASQSNRSSPNLSLDRTSSSRLLRSRSGNIGVNHGQGSLPTIPTGSQGDDDRDPEQVALETSLEDIRRKRASVIMRYDKRLEYLRARLRSAELHERLLK
ncbi:hypothetical protein FRB91_005919 [Serendipita sp. 411]|nr:hypothetical protein FRB91_005919 [Serendipita sp. 411]